MGTKYHPRLVDIILWLNPTGHHGHLESSYVDQGSSSRNSKLGKESVLDIEEDGSGYSDNSSESDDEV